MPSSRPRASPGPDRVVLRLGAVVIVSLLVLACVVVLGGHAWGPVTSDSVGVVAAALATLCALHAGLRNTGPMRLSWLLFAVMILLNAVGATYWLADGGSDGDRSLSWSDALYLAAVVPAGIALLRYPMTSGLRRAWRPALLDGLVMASSMLLLSMVLGLSEVAHTLAGTRAFVFLVYPVMDVVILSLLVVLLLRTAGRLRVDVVLIASTFAAFAVADLGFALSSVRGEQLGDVYLLGYVVAALLLASAALAAATLETRVRRLLPHLAGPIAPLLPDLAAFAALAVAVVVGVSDTAQAVLVTLVLVVTGLRQVLLTTTNLRLRDDLERRVADRTQELRDLTAEHQRLDAMKREFVSAVSHELRTPLTAIRGSLELLADGDAGELPAPARPVVEMATRGSERLSRLVDDIIDLERLESGEFGFRPAPHDLLPLLADAVGSLDALAREAGVEVRIAACPARVVCDGDRVTQALVNLVGNALKFTPPGGTVTIDARRTEEGLRVSVSDTGRGIPPGELEAVFDRFHQVEPDDARQQSGTGLGLSITRRIVEANGGRVWAESEVGVGSTFYFTLPLEDDGPAAGSVAGPVPHPVATCAPGPLLRVPLGLVHP
ncbi:sensor histidine kinase [Nocardioides aurantiacus]|uniref:histidine kinase n=1 Tax=Nocardioides aurantiacus TaxID=86796 RepID=A0A3N2CPK7_9ACTN|nr:ATP-binding protein [Nocardioides aurantiacus]ROR89244.1 phospho-acceptor domain-containing protein [Nocardioides aurantiacus]